jgi:hypothetical protein
MAVAVLFSFLANPAQAQFAISNIEAPAGEVLQYERAQFSLDVAGDFVNPYRSNDIRVDMLLTAPSGESIFLPCYYESGASPSSVWKARFSPRETGEFTYHFELRRNEVLEFATAEATLVVVAGTREGFLTTNDNWTFRFDSGKPFRGIGENIGWESRVWENDLHDYEHLLGMLSSNGGNFFRTWMAPWNMPLEWETVVDTRRYTNSEDYYHRGGIARMDELVELCERLDLYMMLAFDWHGALQTGDRWNINPYNAQNGGPASTPAEFFTSAQARERYKDRLRYIVARWGYSTSIGAWEFFNEIDNAAYNGTESALAIPPDAIASWHDEMSTYLKEIDPYDHVVTTSVSHRELSGLFDVQNIDVVQRHIYRNTTSLPAVIKDGINRYKKPFVVGEFGYDWDWNNIGAAIADELDYDFKRGLWYGLFSPTPILPMTWWWEFFHERGTTTYFNRVRDVSDKMLASGDGAFEQVTVAVVGSGLEAYGVRTEESYYVYLLNNSPNPAHGKRIRIPVEVAGVYAIRQLNTGNGEWADLEIRATASGRITTSGISLAAGESVVLALEPHTGPVTSVQEESNKGSLYPNPARGMFTVSLTAPASRITIYNTQAVAVSSISGPLTGNVSSPELMSGIYTVVVEYVDGRKEYLKSILIQ